MFRIRHSTLSTANINQGLTIQLEQALQMFHILVEHPFASRKIKRYLLAILDLNQTQMLQANQQNWSQTTSRMSLSLYRTSPTLNLEIKLKQMFNLDATVVLHQKMESVKSNDAKN